MPVVALQLPRENKVGFVISGPVMCGTTLGQTRSWCFKLDCRKFERLSEPACFWEGTTVPLLCKVFPHFSSLALKVLFFLSLMNPWLQSNAVLPIHLWRLWDYRCFSCFWTKELGCLNWDYFFWNLPLKSPVDHPWSPGKWGKKCKIIFSHYWGSLLLKRHWEVAAAASHLVPEIREHSICIYLEFKVWFSHVSAFNFCTI